MGSGLFAGGGLVSRDGYNHPALSSPNPNFLLNRNLLPAYIQNQQFLKNWYTFFVIDLMYNYYIIIKCLT